MRRVSRSGCVVSSTEGARRSVDEILLSVLVLCHRAAARSAPTLDTVLKLQCLEDISDISDTVKSIPGQLLEFSLAMGVRQWRESNVD